MTLILVADNDWAIGRDGGLLARLPEDMKHFRETTTGHAVVMGSKTWESFPTRQGEFCPLKYGEAARRIAGFRLCRGISRFLARI